MIPVTKFAGRTVAVLGLAKSGSASARALRAGGAKVVAWDDAPQRRADAEADGTTVADFYSMEWRGVAALVPSPGVPLHAPLPHEAVLLARAAGCEVIGDMELFARENRDKSLGARVAAVTGTNGKSTTTALLAHVLRACGREAIEGGNLGTPVLELPKLGKAGTYVLELSSYQIDLTRTFAADVAVLLNLKPDHIDRHGTMAAYVAAKERLFQQQRGDQVAVIGVDDPESAAMFERLRGPRGKKVIPVSTNNGLGRGVFVQRFGVLWDARHGPKRFVTELSRAKLLGRHNWQNMAIAYTAAVELGCDAEAVAAALLTFPGLAHRIEHVGTVHGVRFINDSKATNADAAARALSCFSNVYWIAGGRPKEGGVESLRPLFARIRNAFLIGEAADAFAHTIGHDVPVTRSGTLARAVADAFAAASRDDIDEPVVLLSPACASFDQFKNFEERGDVFRQLVADLNAQERP
jgi:UDP-N-acetylmuramoylalanine--D-glutamate ligase